ncbi:MAG: SAM-dependent methyltransferase [Betaproteobacteria bacterium]|nr:SAM-dependent methyltransferase [Betaproteobacteria bacterium]
MSNIPEIATGQSEDLLKELHILTRDGKLNQDSRRKLKQVYHLYQFIAPLLNAVYADETDGAPLVVDFGAGKSYLGFILYDLYLKHKQGGEVAGIETRAELVEKSRALAARLGFGRMRFLHLDAAAALETEALPARVALVTALHACDTASDDAIRFACARKSRFIVLAPCCQAEVAALLRRKKNETFGKTPLSELWRHPLHTREFGSQLTNALRCLQLEAAGYQLSVTELVGWEHSLKNELIIARYTGAPRGNAAERIGEILRALNLEELRFRFLPGGNEV